MKGRRRHAVVCGATADGIGQVNTAVNSNLQAFATRLTEVAESLTSAYNALQETVGEMEGVLNRQGKDLR